MRLLHLLLIGLWFLLAAQAGEPAGSGHPRTGSRMANAGSLAGSRPNIVFIMSDDQGYGELSCHGNPILRTPHLDRLHAQSLRFTQ